MITVYLVVSFVLVFWCKILEGSPAVGIVGEAVNMNITISNRDINKNRAVVDPNDGQILVFNRYKPSPSIITSGVTYTGNISEGFVSFSLSNLKPESAGMYQYLISPGGADEEIAGEQYLAIAESPDTPVITVLDQQAIAGREYKLNCSAVSKSQRPGHNLTMYSEWKRNGMNISSDASKYGINKTILTIRILSKIDNNVSLTCLAFEDQRVKSSESSAFILTVQYGPDSIILSPSQMSYHLVENSSLNVNCSADCVPSCQYNWTGPGGNYPDKTGILSISKISRSQTGVFTCTAVNPNITSNSASANVSVTVQYGPDNITLSPSQMSYVLVENSSLTVNCSADCVPSCQYRWTGPGVNYTDTRGILLISKISRSQAGLFTCTAFNPNLTSNAATANISVTVQYGPDIITLSPSNVSYDLVENSSLNINCSAYCVPSCQYRWIGPGVNYTDNRGILSITKISRSQTGVFTCTAFNPNITSNSASVNASVTVQYPPVVSINSENGTYNDTNIALTCTAHGVPEKYLFTLTHSSLFTGMVIRHPSFDNISSGVIRYRFSSYMDTGIYTCTVNNGIADYRDGSVNQSVSEAVWIKEPPIVTSSDTTFDAEKGQTGKLSVEFYNSLLDPNITWYRDKNQSLEKLDSSDKYNISISIANVTLKFYSVSLVQPGFSAALEIRNATTDDFGLYQFIVQNSVGVMSPRVFNLRARGPPDVPHDVRIVPNSITASSVAVEWLSGFHGGFNQTFIIEYRKLADTAWTNFSEKVFGGMRQDQYFNITVEGLYQETMYLFRMFASNLYNNSEYSLVINATTFADIKREERVTNGQDKIIIGSAVGAVVLIGFAVVVSVVIFKRQRRAKSNDAGLQDNPLYDSTDHQTGSINNSGATGDEYASVIKPKRKDKKEKEEDFSSLYAQVNKTSKMGKKGAAANKHQTNSKGDVYENVELENKSANPDTRSVKATTYVDNVYENPEIAEHNAPQINKDGLHYADLMLGPPSKKDGKDIIRGIENRTEYAGIAYGKRGEPLPDSDN